MFPDFLMDYLPSFLFIFLRTSIFMSFMPFFSSKNLPLQFKVGIILSFSIALSPLFKIKVSFADLPFFIVQEVLFGVVIGMAARAIFIAIEMAGQLISNVMGLSIATSFNPEIGQSTEIARFYSLTAMLLFLIVDAHHEVIYILAKSYEVLKPGHILTDNLIDRAIVGGSNLFILALKFSVPVVLILFILNIILGFLYKAAPQMNVFFIGYPIFIFLGFFSMLLSLPFVINALLDSFVLVREEISRILSLSGG
ncbi:MAG: flagellar biosynthetic protein FliR [Thermodesulfovibrionales bacterium]|nr:flagellar biosynthetic protein FliR [Thermodesulfovibrionales bacterium]